MSNEQEFPKEQETLRLLRQKVSIANESAWDASETDLFSDAKSDVYDVRDLLLTTKDLSLEVQQQLLPLAEEGWNAIIDKTSGNQVRGMKASSIMAKLGRKIDEICSHQNPKTQSM
jgi:3-methyladenine DNA glycosylase/8-oxoguanine DNA glycosylase